MLDIRECTGLDVLDYPLVTGLPLKPTVVSDEQAGSARSGYFARWVMRLRGWILAGILGTAITGCGGQGTPTPPGPPSGEDPISVTGRDRLEWDQQLLDGVDIARYRFAAYVDSTRVELSAATCRSTNPGAAVCGSPLPAMSPGVHVLTFVSYLVPDNVESARSTPPLTVIVSAGLTATADPVGGAFTAPASDAGPSDCALTPLPDGTAVVALLAGELRLVDTRRSQSVTLDWTMPDGAWTLRALAAHPDFSRNGWMYVLLSDRSDESTFALVRYRELNGVLGERALLATFSHRREQSRPRLRFGPDGKLYVALLADTAAVTATGATASGREPRAFIMRLTDDGSVPADNPGGRPFVDVIATNPIAFDWDRVTGALWILERLPHGQSVACAVNRCEDPIVIPIPSESVPIALGVVRAPDAPAVEHLWTFVSDGLAHRLDIAGRVSSEPREFAGGGPHQISDALLTADGDVLSCGTRSPRDRRFFVQRLPWR